MQYKILTQIGSGDERKEAGEYLLADPNAKRVRALRALQVDTTYYTDQERLAFVREMRWESEWIEKDEWLDKEGKPTTQDAEGDRAPVGRRTSLKEPKLDRFAFMDRAMQLLFPTAPIAGNEDWIDYEVAEDCLENFTARFERRSKPPSGFLL